MNYVDIIVGQEPSYFIICIYLNDEKKLLLFLWVSITILK